jgi:ATP-dependent RNA helicase DeaD
MKKPFNELGLAPELLRAVEKMGFEEASPIQSLAIPVLLEGHDVVGQSQTGSGKTAAFALPAIQKVDPALRAPQVLILCPTRELAVQVAEEVAKLAAFKKGVRELPIYGGQSYDRQFRGLDQGAQIIIGTPGRLMDHLERGSLKLDQIRMIILDEADRMLDMGFVDDIRTIFSKSPETRQTVLFSATVPRPIQELIKSFTRSPQTLKIESQALTIPDIDQVYYEVDRRAKVDVLCRLIDLHDIKFGIIFCATKMMVDELTEHLIARGYGADKMHGDMTQAMRERVIGKFRRRGIEFLIATDVAARGLDVDDIEVVFNYDLPNDGEDYVHRIGRTGRAGRSGKAITFVSGREIHKFQFMVRSTKSRIKRERVPSAEEVEQKRRNVFFDSLRELLEKGEYTRHDDLIDRLLEAGHAPTDISSALIHYISEGGAKPTEVPEHSPREVPADRERGRSEDRARPRPSERTQERPPRRDHPPQREQDREGGRVHAQSHEPGMIRISFNVGRDHKIGPGDLVGVIAGVTKAPKSSIGAIFIKTKRSYVDIAEDVARVALKKLNGIDFKGRKLACDISREESVPET